MNMGTVVSRVSIPDLGTDAACYITLDHMRAVVLRESTYLICVQCARDIAAGLETFNSEAYAVACYNFVRSFLRFREDHISFVERFAGNGENVEYLQAPSYLLHQPEPQGDCDCYCMLLATLLRLGGVPCSFAVVSQPDAPDSFSHVYVIAYPCGKRLALDASHGTFPGWEYPDAVRFFELPV